MLISFSVENFRSFRDRVVLRMDASADSELIDVVRKDLPGLPATFRGMLTVASIHGANASGKSNLVKAIRLLDSLVYMAMRFPDGLIPDDYPVHLSPTRLIDSFRLDAQSTQAPTKLEILFLLNGTRWAYGLVLDSTKIHSEWLDYWPEGRRVEVFARGLAVDDKKEVFLLDRIETEEVPATGRHAGTNRPSPKADPQQWHKGLAESATPQQECWTWGNEFEKGVSEGQALAGRTRPEVPFLSVAASWNHPQASQVVLWFGRLNVIDAMAQSVRPWENVSRACEADKNVHKWIEAWMRAADLGIAAIEIEKTDERVDSLAGVGTGSRQRFQPKVIHLAADGRPVAFDMQQESHGTNRLFAMALTLYRTLQSGGVYVVDELHTGLHPLLLRALVKIFQSPERNPLNAQLIFTTHDVSVLDNSLLRRDQIHIVEKTASGASDLYSLSECDDKPRKDSPLIKYYLSGHLGGVPDLDLDAAFPLQDSPIEASGTG